MISTNTVKPKENHSLDKFLEETKDEHGQPTGNIISHIPQKPFTTSQDAVKNRPAPALPNRFPGMVKVEQKRPAKTFFQTQDLRDLETKARQEKEAKVKAEQAEHTRKKPGRKAKGK